jgi:ribosomal protein S5
MTTPQIFGVGIIAGIALFFVLQRYGVIDRWFDKLGK